MGQAIAKHTKDFVAVVVLVAIALAVTWIIVQEQRLRVPVLEEKPFELKAEFQTAQAVVPGQGQTIRVAGVRVGDVEEVELEDGKGVVTFAVDREFLPIYRDATILLRPTTGLKDMFFDMDPGSRAAGEVGEGDTLPVQNTAPDVNLDEVLDALDDDTQAYLRLLVVGAGKGLSERDKELGELLGSLGPLNRDLDQLNSKMAERKEELARLVTNFNRLTETVGRSEEDLAELVTTSNAALGAIAEQEPDVARSVALLPSTLSQARETLTNVAELGEVLGPAFEGLRPFARNLEELNASTRELAREATPVLAEEVRPFVRAAREPIPDLRRAAEGYADATPGLVTIGKKINRLGNMAAFNPRGAEPPGAPNRDEGYLYWAAWLSHNGNSVFEAQDAHGLYRRIYFTVGCPQASQILSSSPLAPVVTGLGALYTQGGPCQNP